MEVVPLPELQSLSVERRGVSVLNQIDLKLRTGTLALVGLNGAGKSTLLSALLGLVTWHTGDVRVGDASLRDDTTMRMHRRRLGWLPQEPGYPRAMKGADYVAYAAWLKEYPRRRIEGAVCEALEATATGHLARRRLSAMSGGERRRVFLAAALVSEPTLLLLDEPTAGLDPLQREHFHEVLNRLSGDRCIVVATHLLEDVAITADQIAVLAGGRLSSTLERSDIAGPAGRVDVDTLRSVLTPLLRPEPR